MKNLLKMGDLSPAELTHILDVADQLKADCKAGRTAPLLAGKSVALLFSKASTRTRTSFEVGVYQLGGLGNYMNAATELQSGRGEPLKDTARVLGRMYDGIEYRGFSQDLVQELSDYAGVPVWNGLTDQFHPTQMLADLLTIEEKLGRLKGVRFTYFGDARNNMGNSLMVACAKMGMHFAACAPKELFPEEWLVEKARSIAQETGGSVTLTEDVTQGATNADVIYTDIWVSMGEPDSVWSERIRLLTPYQVNAKVMSMTAPGAIFMHCLPSFHDTRTTIGADIAKKFGITEMEVTDQVFESKQSVVFDEAENRMHTIKAVIYATLH